MDSRVILLIEKRLRFNWIGHLTLFVGVLIFIMCASSGEYFFILALISLFSSFGIADTFRKVLSEGESYHALSGLRLKQSSSYGVYFFCVAFEVILGAFVFLFFVYNSLIGCTLAV